MPAGAFSHQSTGEPTTVGSLSRTSWSGAEAGCRPIAHAASNPSSVLDLWDYKFAMIDCMRGKGFVEIEPPDSLPDVAAPAPAIPAFADPALATPAFATGIGAGIEYEPPPGFCLAVLVERSWFLLAETDPEHREVFVERDIWDAIADELRVTFAAWVSNCVFDGKSVTLRDATRDRYLGLYSRKSGFLPGPIPQTEGARSP